MTDWQPIETAPKDGTWVLLYGGETDEFTKDGADIRIVTAFWMPEGTYSGWRFAHWDSDWRSYYNNPTYWMPLPEPPKPDKTNA